MHAVGRELPPGSGGAPAGEPVGGIADDEGVSGEPGATIVEVVSVVVEVVDVVELVVDVVVGPAARLTQLPRLIVFVSSVSVPVRPKVPLLYTPGVNVSPPNSTAWPMSSSGGDVLPRPSEAAHRAAHRFVENDDVVLHATLPLASALRTR